MGGADSTGAPAAVLDFVERGLVTREDTPEYCGRCHSNAALIRKYRPGQRADQLALYRKSFHGEQLAKGNKKTANCVDCHGIHNVRAVDDSRSPVHPSQLADRCGTCHGEIAGMFRQSPDELKGLLEHIPKVSQQA